jgi:hypothetical protein
MKLKIFFLLCLPFLGTAQSFQQSQMDLNVGLGLGTTFAYGNYRNMPPISASLDYGVTKNISVGAYLAFAAATWRNYYWEYCNSGNGVGNKYYVSDTYRWNYYILGVRGAFHFAEFIDNDKIDLYAGLMLGDNIAHSSWTTDSPCPDHGYYWTGSSQGGFIFSGFAGCRYRFTEKVGAFAELGYGISYLNLGVNFKLQ